MNIFENWCTFRGMPPVPAPPAQVATFISECADLGMEKLWPLIGEISRAHYLIGLADPTLGGPVSAAICAVAPIVPPRSWPKEHKASFARLPYDMQVYLDGHEKQRDKEIRRAQNEAATLRQKLAAALKSDSPVATLLEQRKQTDGNSSQPAA